MTEPRPGDGGIVLVPHTHWDREWYEPFQVFRLRLVAVLDDVLDRAGADPDFRFTVDGQLAAVEDYLAIRPERRDELRRLVERGQVAIGPWHILLDEFLCSGETIVRNLELGWTGASALGGAMPVGYLPDMFGHCAQMPQILARAGIADASLWRGVPGRVRSHAFSWQAPDGSAVRVEYLFDAYGNGLDMFALPERLSQAAVDYRDQVRPWFGETPVLAMLGTDHSSPRPDLMDLLRRHAGTGVDVPLTVATLTEYVAARSGEESRLDTVVGELRSHARGNILPGVLSVRRDLKRAMARAEDLTADAERLAAQWSDARFAPYLDLAWRRIIESSAHDSVTGCGVDETAEQVAARLAEAAHLARAVRDRVLDDLAAAVPSGAHLVVNRSPRPRTDLVELDVAVADDDARVVVLLPDGTSLPTQELSREAALLADEQVPAELLARIPRRIHGRELFGRQLERYRVADGHVALEVAEVPGSATFDMAALTSELESAAAGGTATWRVTTTAERRRRLLVQVPVPATGHVAIRPVVLDRAELPAEVVAPVRVAGEAGLENGHVQVSVGAHGTLVVRSADGTVLEGVGRLVDGGDRGDSYNYGPPAHDRLVEEPRTVEVTVTERGPLRGRLSVIRTYDWPHALSPDPDRRSEAATPVTVATAVELRAGEPFVRLELAFTNLVRDHRLRWHVPLPAPVETSAAEGQLAVTTRGLTSEGGWGEFPLPTYPASAFVNAGPATVLLEHATEYELVDGAAELALTLLRAVGWMSVNVHPLRDEPAASQIAVPGAQALGVPARTRLAVVPHAGGWAGAAAYRLGEDFRHPLLVRRGTAAADVPAPAAGEGLAVEGDGVSVCSTRPRGGGVEVRMVALHDTATRATVTTACAEATVTDLLGRPLHRLEVREGRVVVDLSAWEIATLLLR
jgi:mannosylglycerate hydrolase